MAAIDISNFNRADMAPADPFDLFRQWLAAAEASEKDDPNAMALATADEKGRPALRTVLLKHIDERGFVFYTNRESRKGRALAVNPYAAVNFLWKSLDRQVDADGAVMPVSDAESDAYFASRPRGSRIAAWASSQSRPLESRQILADRVKELEAEYEGREDIPRPPHWGGYVLAPSRIAFWQEAPFRLHARVVYTRAQDTWERRLLYP
ncbi:MAG TPA: pyridoxamine 5'-phosphate oxidase [Alphaproteobacteria bacterium]